MNENESEAKEGTVYSEKSPLVTCIYIVLKYVMVHAA